jgi:hypothetical protein
VLTGISYHFWSLPGFAGGFADESSPTQMPCGLPRRVKVQSFHFIALLVIILIAVIYFLSVAAGDVMIAVILGLAVFVTVVSGLRAGPWHR